MTFSRRLLLKAGFTLPVFSVESLAPKITSTPDSAFDPWVEIHQENLRHNVREIYRWVASRPILAVVKNNGYGGGIVNIAQILDPMRVRIGGQLYPVIASVSASHCILEIGAERRVEVGDIATVFDWQQGSRPEGVSLACGTSVYDLTMHLNPLLPRRVL